MPENLKLEVVNQRAQQFIGREDLIQLLHDRYMISRQGFQEVLISGEAGVGKTFAVQEFLSRISAKIFLITCKFENTENPQKDLRGGLLKEALSFWGIDVEFYSERLRDVICYCCNITDHDLIYLLDYFFLKDKRKINVQNVALSEFTKLFLLIVKNLSYQVTIVFDDVQWVTPEIKKFISELRHAAPANIYLIETSRELLDIQPTENFIYYKLGSHSSKELQQLISTAFPNLLFSNKLIEFLYSRTQGNALYATELLQHLIFAKKLKMSRDGLDVTPTYKIPVSLITTVSDRLAQVENSANDILNILVCIDQPIGFETLRNILNVPQDDLLGDLDLLKTQRLIKEDIFGKYEFIHDLIKSAFHDLADEKILKKAHLEIFQEMLKAEKPDYILLANHSFDSEIWKSAYRYNLVATKKSLDLSSPFNALKYLRRCQVCAEKLDMLSETRDLRLSLFFAKAYFMIGRVRDATQYISVANNFLKLKRRSNSLTQDAVSYLSHCYWNTGEFKKAMKSLSHYIDHGIDHASRRTLQVRLSGILSDMGDFESSNKIALFAIEEIADEQRSASSDLIFPAETMLSCIIARNYAYLNKQENFEIYAAKTLDLIRNEHAPSIIFPLCFLADAYTLRNDIEFAQGLLLRAVETAKKFQFTVLNVFIFSLLGYIEVQQGNYFSLRKIQQAVDSAEGETRLGRLPLYYLYLLKAKVLVRDKSDLKRSANRALKLAKQNGESWTQGEIQRLMADYC